MSNLRSKKNRAKANKIKQKELDTIMDEKIQFKVKLQKEFKEKFLTRKIAEADIEDMGSMLEAAKSEKKDRVDWYGTSYTIKSASLRMLRHIHNYKEIVSEENYLRQALKNDGISDEDINSIANDNKYITDREYLLEAEKKATDERLRKQEEAGNSPKAQKEGVTYFG